MPNPRLDELLVSRGEFDSIDAAKRACIAKTVSVNGIITTQSGLRIDPNSQLSVKQPRRFVSRGGDKLQGALESFDYSPLGLKCIDVGTSSGGFSDCLLQNGASSVTAVDVGYGQFDYKLRVDPRVHLFERTNITSASPDELGAPFELLVADLSFTGIARLAPTLAKLIANLNDCLVLVKPQFELPKALVKNGVIKNPQDHQKAIKIAAEALSLANLQPIQLAASKLPGPKGNIEFFLLAKKAATPVNIDIEKVVQAAHSTEQQ
jgi:23S rRNA (cytidine1920-2'-O)/16S rRNA (cytidine1409-2'-O)-methyltransferase